MTRCFALVCMLTISLIPSAVLGEDPVPQDKNPGELQKDAPGCFAPAAFREVWIKVAERSCLKCHHAGGDASESAFLLREETSVPMAERLDIIRLNCDALTKVALFRETDGSSRILAKVTGGLDH